MTKRVIVTNRWWGYCQPGARAVDILHCEEVSLRGDIHVQGPIGFDFDSESSVALRISFELAKRFDGLVMAVAQLYDVLVASGVGQTHPRWWSPAVSGPSSGLPASASRVKVVLGVSFRNVMKAPHQDALVRARKPDFNNVGNLVRAVKTRWLQAKMLSSELAKFARPHAFAVLVPQCS